MPIKYLKGSSLIEVVTGIFLISLAIGLCASMFSKTMDSSKIYLRHKAVSIIDEMVVNRKKRADFTPAQIDTDKIVINISLDDFRCDSLQIVSYSAFTEGKELYRRKTVEKIKTK